MWQRGWVCTTNQSLDFDRVLYKLRGEEKVSGNNSYPEILMNTRFQAFQPRWVCRKTDKTITSNLSPWQGSSKTRGVPCSSRRHPYSEWRDTHRASMCTGPQSGMRTARQGKHVLRDQLSVCF